MTSDRVPLVVVTGASGVVGRRVVAALDGVARMRLVDRRAPTDAPPTAERVVVDLREHEGWDTVIRDADVVVHLAGNASPFQDARTVIHEVAELAAGLADAVERSNVRHLVMASSIHTLGRHDVAGHRPVRASDPVWPCCDYGAGKVFAEDVLGLACMQRDAVFTALRLGLVGWKPVDALYRSNWTSDRDFATAVRAVILQRPAGPFLIASNGARGRWDIEETEERLGIEFIDDPPASHPVSRPDEEIRCLMLMAGGSGRP
ncbi:NAD-dependent epimerase/dehydratase family protein [Agromyces albus]|nr:NAD(P)-dependent oxidoreductase [Agromyces albus]